MRTTDNLGLQIPEDDDFYGIEHVAHNMNILDNEMKDIKDASINDESPAYEEATELTKMTSGEKISVAFGKMAKAISTIISHIKTVATSTVSGHVKVATGNGLSNSSGTISISKGNGTDYGSVKLSDVYKSKVTNGAAANSVGASQNALYEAYNEINNSLTKVNLKVNSEGKLVFTNSAGADSVIPFSSLPKGGTIFTKSGVNMKDYFPYTWQKLRTGDFICGVTNFASSVSYNVYDSNFGSGGQSVSASISVNYNHSTGILTFSCSNGSKQISHSNNGTWWIQPSTSFSGLFCAWKGTYSG